MFIESETIIKGVRRAMSASKSAPLATQLERPVFVIGYMHSGTTLLLQILAAQTKVFSGAGETKFFDFLPMFRRLFPNLTAQDARREYVKFVLDVIRHSYRLGKPDANVGTAEGIAPEHLERLVAETARLEDHADYFNFISDDLTRCAGKNRWLEKTPTHILQIDQIVKSVPGALFVEIVRDVRDVLASKKTRRQIVWTTDRYTEEEKPFKNHEKSYDPLWDALSWKSTVRAGQLAREKYPDRIITIRYEDLVREPENYIRRVCDFLELEFESAMINAPSRNSAEHGESKKSGISGDAVGRWQRTLSPAETAFAQSIVKAEMKLHDYQPMDYSLTQRATMPLLATRSMFEFSQRLYHRWRLGGSMYSLNVLLNYWKRFRKLVHN